MILHYTLFYITAAIVYLSCIFGLPISKSYAGDNTEARSLQILLIHSWGKDRPWPLQIETGLKTKLKEEGHSFKLFFAHLDTSNFPQEHQRDEMARHLQQKFKDANFDIVLTVGFPAATFIKKRTELFPKAKKILVSTGVKGSGSAYTLSENTIAIEMTTQYEKSFKEMLRLKNPQNVYVVADTLSPGGAKRIESFKNAIRMHVSSIDIHYLLNLPMEKLLETVSNLPANSALFYMLIFQDGNKNNFSISNVLQMLSASANSPVFTNWEVLLGSGTVGGYLVSGKRVGEIIADSILKQKSTEIQTLAEANPYGYYYDWRQLKRWEIDVNSLPPGSTIRFRELTAFEKYRWEIIFSVSALFLFMLLSAILIAVNRKRSIAVRALSDERQLLESRVEQRTRELGYQTKMLEDVGRITKTGGWVMEVSTMQLKWSAETYRIHEVSDDYEPNVEEAIKFYAPGSQPIITAAVEAVYKNGTPYDLQLSLITAKGRSVWVRALGEAIYENGELKTVMGTFQDITKRMLAEKATRQLLQQNRDLAQRMFQVQEQERRHLSQELHDEFGQWITALSLHARVLDKRCSNNDVEMHKSIKIIDNISSQMHQKVHNMIHQLKPGDLDTFDLKDSLIELINQWQQIYPQTHCIFQIQGSLDDFSGMARVTIYRVIQEGLTNVAKHAEAENVSIQLHRNTDQTGNPSSLFLHIQDDGKGINLDKPTQGVGLAGMRERILATGGEFKLNSSPGEGVKIHMLIPPPAL